MCANVYIDPGKRRDSAVYHCGDGYSYYVNKRIHYEDNSVAVKLRCAKYSSISYTGRALVVEYGDDEGEEAWFNVSPHIRRCPRDATSHGIRMMRQELRDVCRQEPHNMLKVLHDRIALRFPECVATRLSFPRVRYTMRRARLSRYPQIPESLRDLGNILDGNEWNNLTCTADGLDSVYSATVGPPGASSVIFVSVRMLRFLRTVKYVFVDATFSSTPSVEGAVQVYQIVTLLRGQVVPIILAIMESKTFEAYTAVLQHIQQMCPQFLPSKAMMDFERANCKAWQEIYPDCDIVGCFVHHIRAVLKKCGELGLKRGINRSRRVKLIVRCCVALPLLPANFIERGFATIIQQAHRLRVFDYLTDFLYYYWRTWLRGWRSNVLSVFEEPYRTSNPCEAAHHSLRLITGPVHPNIWTFIEGLRTYEQRAFRDVRAFRRGITFGIGRKVSAMRNDEAIRNFSDDFVSGNISIRRFLLRASRRATDLFEQQL